MRTRAERPANASLTGHAPAAPGNSARTPQARPRAAGDAVGPDLDAAGLLDLQSRAGNRASVQALRATPVAQRAVTETQALAIARRLEDAMSGLGTDEEAIYGALAGRPATDMAAIRTAYAGEFHRELDADLQDELSESELAHVSEMMAPVADETRLSEGERQAAGMDRARVAAAQLREAMAGLGTEEDQIYNALEGRTPAEIEEIKRQYTVMTTHPLEVDLVDELSGSELERALALLGVRDAGTFTNSHVQNMTEQVTTVVQGRFNYSLSDGRLDVDVPVHFVPAPGITVPLGAWQGQIDSVWNQFAVREPGGQSVQVHMGLRDDSGDSRTIDVVQNARPGVYAYPDRANAGKWYPAMPTDTAPHEFGHLIGLRDEYQRTHGDFRAITGEDRAGPPNTSGRTPQAIARDLHDALYLEDATQRAPGATSVLKAVGLITGTGTPQQGDFAQSVMSAYDEEFGGVFSRELLEALVSQLPDGSRWTLQSVFSYASGTVMGNPDTVGVAAHEHPVEPRHLREFRDMVARQWPEKTWSVGPK